MTSTAPPRPQHDTPPPSVGPAPRPPRRRLDLSATQLIATAFAAITATVAGSYLGVTGTVIGAALASVLTAVGNAVYGTTLRSTRDRVRAAVPGRRGVDASDPTVSTDATGAPAARPRPLPGPRPDLRPDLRDPEAAPVLPSTSPRPHRAPSPVDVVARTWRRVALSSIAVFVAVIAVVTGVEIVAGRPLADVVRGDGGSGTSLFGDSDAGTVTTPVPTITRTVIPKVVFTTPTVTMPAPVTVTVTPSTTVTGTPTSTGSAPGSASASPTASPSASGSSAAIP